MAFIVAVPIQLWDQTGKSGAEANASAVVQACLKSLDDPEAEAMACGTQVLASLLHRRQQVVSAFGIQGAQELLLKLHAWCGSSVPLRSAP